LRRRLGLAVGLKLGLVSLSGGVTLLQKTQTRFKTLGELFTSQSLNALHELLHTTIGSDAEADGFVSHPSTMQGEEMLTGSRSS